MRFFKTADPHTFEGALEVTPAFARCAVSSPFSLGIACGAHSTLSLCNCTLNNFARGTLLSRSELDGPVEN
jgi:hypothetical protein